jgi:RNA polymerase sigma factor (sigma-70 family)
MRRFGLQHFALIENAVQDAGLRALDHWRNDAEVNLEGWLLRVAHNRLVDALRRERRFVSLEKQHIGASQPPTTEMDDELRLVFLCCHPELTRASQIALTLRVAFGFATEQIARAFLSDSRTIAQRIVRAKQRLKGVRGSIRHPR